MAVSTLSECLGPDSTDVPDGYSFLRSKQPIYENGNYRLNFNGRVSIPSVKNFQLVMDGDDDNIICQFGKVISRVVHSSAFMLKGCQDFNRPS